MDWITGVLISVVAMAVLIFAILMSGKATEISIANDCEHIGKTILYNGAVLSCSIEPKGR